MVLQSLMVCGRRFDIDDKYSIIKPLGGGERATHRDLFSQLSEVLSSLSLFSQARMALSCE